MKNKCKNYFNYHLRLTLQSSIYLDTHSFQNFFFFKENALKMDLFFFQLHDP